MKQFEPFLKSWRTVTVGDREIVDAVVSPDHIGPSDALQEAVDGWAGAHYWVHGDGLDRLVLIRALGEPARERWGLHVGLFAVTFLTVLMAGAMLANGSIHVSFAAPRDLLSGIDGVGHWFRMLAPGFEFAAALMAILLIHELGHYVAAKRYGIDASPPYFLPAPMWWTLIGTFGAFIRIRSPIVDRRQLMDVGAAGPWAGFIVALACLAYGFANSTIIQLGGDGQILAVGAMEIPLGDSLIVVAMREVFRPEGLIAVHPVAFAGWLGVFVTTLNLLPIGQLDGGHVLYAMVGDKQKFVGWLMWLTLVGLGLYAFLALGLRESVIWLIWAGLTFILGRGELGHPSVLDRHRPVPPGRMLLGWATVILFIITFSPLPFSV